MDERKIKYFCLGPDISEDLVLVKETGGFAQMCNDIFSNPKTEVSLTVSQYNALFKVLQHWEGKKKDKYFFDSFAEKVVNLAQRRSGSFKLVYEDEKNNEILIVSLKKLSSLKSNITKAVESEDLHRDSTLLKIMKFLLPYHKEKIITMAITEEEKKRLQNLGQKL